MLTASFLRSLELSAGRKLKKKLHVRRVTPVAGGSINLSAKLDTSAGIFFLKTNDPFRYPNMFQKEAGGLKTLRDTEIFFIPDVILTGEEEGHAFILIQWIDSRAKTSSFWQDFGRSLAKLHKVTTRRFGFTEDNYIGSLSQSNKEHNNWKDFFIEERLEKQLALAVSSGKMDSSIASLFKKVYSRIDDVMPVENPSLLHGDLWSGNFMPGAEGQPCLFDPAVYYGHREMDLAMTRLFGGFDDEFYNSYEEEFKLAPGFGERVDLHNLYPLMVHVNLFGGDYISQVKNILKKYN